MKKFFTTTLAIALSLGVTIPAFALGISGNAKATVTGAGVNAHAGASANGTAPNVNITAGTDAQIQARAAKEIDKRIEDLNALKTRIAGMKRLTSDAKATMTATITTEISVLTSLKTKISTETGEALKTDAKSITGSYRVYMLVMPQARIIVAADKELSIADMMATLSGKLQTRISAKASAGADVTALQKSLTDMNAKIADAKVQAQAAITLVANLTPDQNDKTKMEANKKALTDARAKLKAAHEDLKDARELALSIVVTLKGNSGPQKDGHSNPNDREGEDQDNH